MCGSCTPPEGPTTGRCAGPRWRPGQVAPCIGWCSFALSADQRPQRRPTPRPGTARTQRRGTCQPSCCASCVRPSPSTPAPPDPAGSASGTATAGCTAAPRSRSWVVTGPSPSRRRSLPGCWMDLASSSRAETTCCSPVRWPQHRNSLDRPVRLLLSPVTQSVLAARPRLVRRLRDRPVLHPGGRVRGPRPGSRGQPAP